ncbi:hypothetical protein [Streptomyces sp. NPDC058579]|uniref:hypothetical protein n=1 Tax=Streptomyces sp. NPDC058579 TaxID=3346548 RepID=UPI0036463FDB
MEEEFEGDPARILGVARLMETIIDETTAVGLNFQEGVSGVRYWMGEPGSDEFAISMDQPWVLKTEGTAEVIYAYRDGVRGVFNNCMETMGIISGTAADVMDGIEDVARRTDGIGRGGRV